MAEDKGLFRLKQFELRQGRSAMKVGTDAIALGAWVASLGIAPRRVLDVGSGTGILALMMAQAFPEARVDALEIEEGAAQDARDNFARSPWAERLRLYEVDALQFCPEEGYDLIISNPPYFGAEDYRAEGEARQTARQERAEGLGVASLLRLSATWLSPTGVLCLVLPLEREEALRRAACEQLLGINRLCRVGKETGYYNRLLCCMQGVRGLNHLVDTEFCALVVRDEVGGYSLQYKQLVQDYLLG